MKRRDFLALLCGAAAAWPRSIAAQSSRKRIGVFLGFERSDPQWSERFGAFNDAFQKLGWVDGKNVSFEMISAIGPPDSLPALADRLVASKVDAIVVQTAGLASVVHNATKTIPIVVCAAGELEGTGLIASLNRPGGNVTGSQILSPNLMSKRLDLLKQLVPGLRRLGVVLPITPAGIITARYLDVIDETAQVVGIEVQRVEVRSPEEFARAYADMQRDKCQAAIVISNPLALGHRKRLLEAALIPTMYETENYVRDGGLVSYGASIQPLYREAASYMDKILRGASPADLPVNQPTQFELAINLQTSKAFGLAVPPTVLALADRVFE